MPVRSLILLPFLTVLVGACDDPDRIHDLVDKLGKDHGGRRPRPCSGPATCGPREFCESPPGTCGGGGVCRPRPEVCTEIFAPVCGCDGETYGNDCQRAAAGVSKTRDGACTQTVEVGEGEACEGFVAPPIHVCKPGLFCMKRPGTCRLADVGGVCEVTPTACTKEFRPVCGCDGKTYGNDCERRAARVGLDHEGRCGAGEGEMCAGFAGIACAEGLFCDLAPGSCNVADAAGLCKVRPELCPAIFDPVCGCDGKTYPNDCSRQSAQIAKAHDGACTP